MSQNVRASPGPSTRLVSNAGQDDGRYTRVAVVLHWVIAILVLTTIPLGVFSANSEGVLSDELTNVHKVIGIVILTLTMVRIAWRLLHRPPPLPEGMTPLFKMLARATHLGFYLVLVIMPLSGWWLTSAFPGRHKFGIPGVLEIPFLPVTQSMATAVVAATIHEFVGWFAVLLIALHVAAALKHHFIDSDNVLRRMT